jgi:hypothetical protein
LLAHGAPESLSAIGRAMVSVAEPGVKGTMIRIGLDGKACAMAAEEAIASSADSKSFIGGLLWQYDATVPLVQVNAASVHVPLSRARRPQEFLSPA